MCLIFFSLNKHTTYKLILAANRDEFYNRKTALANYWTEHPHILGGRDLEAQGTWMALSRYGKLGMVTNYRDFKNLKVQAPSRGQLVSDYLIENEHPENYLKKIKNDAETFNGFNLIVGNQNQLWYLSNYKEGISKIENGVYGLSNALLNTPWPKVESGKKKFEKIIQDRNIKKDSLFDLLYNTEIAPDHHLPDTGIGLERERMLSAMFIKTPNYGSRCSTVILIDKNDYVIFSERTYNLQTFEHTTLEFSFKIQPL